MKKINFIGEQMDYRQEPENCWQKLNCGRVPGGRNTLQYGVCPAYLAGHLSGINRGKMGGRACFAIDGTFTQLLTDDIPGFKRMSCSRCPQLKCIMEQEGNNFSGRKGIKEHKRKIAA